MIWIGMILLAVWVILGLVSIYAKYYCIRKDVAAFTYPLDMLIGVVPAFKYRIIQDVSIMICTPVIWFAYINILVSEKWK